MRRRSLALGMLAVAAALAAYWFVVRDHGASPGRHFRAVATIGTGSREMAVGATGSIRPLPAAGKGRRHLPSLPLSRPPAGGRVAGPALEQVRVLAAAPPRLRPYLAASSIGKTGVDVELANGVELRFGDASQAARKWRTAAAVLADPEITALDYVDLHAPSRPAIWGEGHRLAPPP